MHYELLIQHILTSNLWLQHTYIYPYPSGQHTYGQEFVLTAGYVDRDTEAISKYKVDREQKEATAITVWNWFWLPWGSECHRTNYGLETNTKHDPQKATDPASWLLKAWSW